MDIEDELSTSTSDYHNCKQIDGPARPTRVTFLSCASSPAGVTFENNDLDGVRQVADLCLPYLKKLKLFAGKVYYLVKSEVGLVLALAAYTVAGAYVFVAIEQHPIASPMNETLRLLRQQLTENFLNDSRSASDFSSPGDFQSMTPHDSRTSRDFVFPLNRTANSTPIDTRQLFQSLRFIEAAVWEKSSVERSTPERWTIWEGLFFCCTVFTTIGYGNIVPSTNKGKLMTMAYAMIGIPLCLIVLSKLGKFLTRCFKHLWSFVRRFYYTGHCRMMRMMIPLKHASMVLAQSPIPIETDETKFKLPPIIAILIACLYIFIGVIIYTTFEDWSFLDAFYFTFISLSTIGFGDIVPHHPKFFIASSVYMLFGLSLVAMVINVVMENLNATINKATDQLASAGQRFVRVTSGSIGSRKESKEHRKSKVLKLYTRSSRRNSV